VPWKYLPLAFGRSSPAAQAERLGLSLSIDSAGTGDWHVGRAPDERAVAWLRGTTWTYRTSGRAK
jgi:protein-tyrosine-phosphatase